MLHPDIHFLDFILPPFHLGAPSVPASRFTKPCTHYPRTCLRLTALAHIFLLGWSCHLASSIWVTPCPRLLHPWARAQAHCLPCFDTSSLLYPLTLGAAFCLWGHDPSWPLYLLGYFCCCYPQVSLLRLHWKRWVDLQKYQKWFLHMAKLGEGGHRWGHGEKTMQMRLQALSSLYVKDWMCTLLLHQVYIRFYLKKNCTAK